MPQLSENIPQSAEGDLELGSGADTQSDGSSGSLERAADELLRAAYDGDDPAGHFRDLGILTPSRERTISKRERTASAYPSIQRLWYGEGEDEGTREG